MPVKLRVCLTALLMSLSLVSGCASQVNYERYSLTLDVAPEVFGSELLKRVSLADTLALHGGGLLMRVSDVSVVESPTYRYAQSLAQELKLRAASVILESGKDKEAYSYRLEVSRFWGTLDGEAEVALSLRVVQEGRVVSDFSGESVTPLTADGYAELTRCLKEGFDKLMGEALAEL